MSVIVRPARARPTPDRAAISPAYRRSAVITGGAVCAWLIPWSSILLASLPATTSAHHWRATWVGLDLGEAAAAGLTALLLRRGDRRAALPAMALATLLAADAWFDVLTSAPGGGFALALGEAMLLEIPLAVAAAHLAYRLTAVVDGEG